MSLSGTPTSQAVDISRQNAEENKSIISKAYYWYQWGKTAKTIGRLALSANPSGAVKFAAQMTLQPLADKLAKRTNYPRISQCMRVAIACTDPVGSAISYGAQKLTKKILKEYKLNPHIEAVLEIASQEASSRLATGVKSTQTYQAASDYVTQRFEETNLGLKANMVQKRIDDCCERFDQNKIVKAANARGNQLVEAVSSTVTALPGARKVAETKQWVEEKKQVISKKLEVQAITNLSRKAHKVDNTCAAQIRNSRLNNLRKTRQTFEGHLEKVQKNKREDEEILSKWQQRKQNADQSNNAAEQRQAKSKIKEYESKIARHSQAEKSISDRLAVIDKNVVENATQVREIRYRELNDKLEALNAREKAQEHDLKNARSEEKKKSSEASLKATRKKIGETASSVKDLLDSKEAKSQHAKNRVIVYIWSARDEYGRIISQAEAEKNGQNPGHVSMVLPNGKHISFVPAKRAEIPRNNKWKARAARLNDIQTDIELEGTRTPDKIFTFYTLDTEAMLEAFSAAERRVSTGDIGWHMYDNVAARALSAGHRILTPGRITERGSDGQPISSSSNSLSLSLPMGNATNCAGFANELLAQGGIDNISPIPLQPGEFVSRYVVSSPEHLAARLEQSQHVENATYPDTQELRQRDHANIQLELKFERKKYLQKKYGNSGPRLHKLPAKTPEVTKTSTSTLGSLLTGSRFHKTP